MKKLILFALFGIFTILHPMEEGNSKKGKEIVEISCQNSNNNATELLGKKTITQAVKSGSHERFTSILQPYNEKFLDIVNMMNQEGLTTMKFISAYFSFRWIHLYYNMLVAKGLPNPQKKTIELLKKSSELNSTMIDENPAVEFSNSIPISLQLLIKNIVKDHSLLSKKYFYVKTFQDEPRTLQQSDGKLITFHKNGELQLNIQLSSNDDYNKGVIIHEITHAILGEIWMQEVLKKENLTFTKAMHHLVERQADLLLASTSKEYAKLVQEHLETLHKEQPDTGALNHPSTISRLEDIIVLNKLLAAEENIKREKQLT